MDPAEVYWDNKFREGLLDKRRQENEQRAAKEVPLAVGEVVRRVYGRAGIQRTPEQIQHIVDGLIANQDPIATAKTDPDYGFFNALLSVGDPDQDVSGFNGDIHGVPIQEIRDRMLDGYSGRGWTPSEEQKLGHQPEYYERSPGQKMADKWSAQEQFLTALRGAKTPEDKIAAMDVLNRELYQTDDYRRTWERLGHTVQHPDLVTPLPVGVIETMDDPAYQHARAMIGMDQWSRAAKYAFRDPGIFFNNLWNSGQKSRDYQEIWANSNRASPRLPQDYDSLEDREQAYRDWAVAGTDALPQDTDDANFQTWGVQPSYAGSTLNEFAMNAPDPFTLLGLGLITKPGKFLPYARTAGQVVIRGMGPSARATLPELSKALGKEVAEEAATSGAIGTAVIGAQEGQKSRLSRQDQTTNPAPVPVFGGWGKGRTDLYTRNKDGEWVPETATQTKARINEEEKAQKKAFALPRDHLKPKVQTQY